MPIPILVVSPDGRVTTNHAFEERLGRLAATVELVSRFEIASWGGTRLAESELPWERALREDFGEEEIWYDRVTSSRLRYYVRGRLEHSGGILVLEDLSAHSMRLAEFLEAAARSGLADTVERTGAQLAREVANVTAADAVFVYAASRTPETAKLLGTSRVELAPGPLEAAVEAMRTRTRHEVAAMDSPDITCPETRRLVEVGLRSLVALPLAIAGSYVGALVVAWHQTGALQVAERRTLDAIAGACAAALVHAHARHGELAESALLHKLRAAALAIRELPSVHDVMEVLVDQACELTGARRGAVGLLDADGSVADVIEVNRNARDARDRSAEMRGMLRALATGATPPVASSVGARLRVDSHSIGGVFLSDKQDGQPFSEEDKHVLELFGSQAALAIGYSRQLQRAEVAQRQLANLHDELAAVIAHDMRSPIASILLQLETLLERGRPEGRVVGTTAALGRLRHAGEQISRLADDLLDASRIELGRVALDRQPVRLPDAIASLVAQLAPTVTGRRVEIQALGDVPSVSVDPLRLEQILTNLLENAAKYSAPGRPIVVRTQREGTGATITVADEGPGIPADEIPRLFDRFFQARRAREKKSGLGLGLYITKGLVDAHGGRIWVDSSPGRGSQFHIELPGDAAQGDFR